MYILKYSTWLYKKVLFALGHFKLGYEFTRVNDTTTIKKKPETWTWKLHFIWVWYIVLSLIVLILLAHLGNEEMCKHGGDRTVFILFLAKEKLRMV